MNFLILHWPLDAVLGTGRAFDAGEYQNDGTVRGNPATVADATVGSCLELDGVGDGVERSQTMNAGTERYTVEAWVRPASGDVPYKAPIVVRHSLRIGVADDGSVIHRFVDVNGLDDEHVTAAGAMPRDEWRHLAVTYDGRWSRIYLDGVEVTAREVAIGPLRPAPPIQVGLAYGTIPGDNLYFRGRLAHVRVYEGALTPLEIQRDIDEDEGAIESFVRTHPLDIALRNADDQPVLYIEEGPPAQVMTVELTNRTRRDIEPVPLTGTPSATNSHVTLSFRRGTLPAGLAPTPTGADWAVATEADGTAIHLQWRATKALAPGAATALRLGAMNADGAAGTRGTSVEAAFRRLRYTGDTAEVSGTLTQFLDVVNHRGRRDIPLDLRLVGGDRVLSGGATTPLLVLHLANVRRDGPGIPFPRTAKLRLSYDLQKAGSPTRPWALAVDDKATLAVPTGWTSDRADESERMEWTIQPSTDTVLAADTFLELALKGVAALAETGHAPILLEYLDVPGYADGALTVSVERSPLLYSDARVGIGTRDPDGYLHVLAPDFGPGEGPAGVVVGAPKPGSLRIGHHARYSWLQTNPVHPLALNPTGGNVGIGVAEAAGRLQIVDRSSDATGTTLVLGPGGGSLRLGYHDNYGWMQSAKALAINPTGNPVTVGTVTPMDGTKVTVNAPSYHLQLRRDAGLGGGGNVVYLELYQDRTAGDKGTYPSIRFHQSWLFFHRLEGRPTGFHFKVGNPAFDDLVDIYAATANVNGLKVGGTTITEDELKVLKKLAAGQLQVDLRNLGVNEYVFAENPEALVPRSRAVYTAIGQGRQGGRGRWQIEFPG